MIFAILAAAQIFAVNLNTDMSRKDKKATGIKKLSSQEKAALQQWIDTHYQTQASKGEPIQEVSKPPVTTLPTLSENLLNSQYLRLSDNSLWHIRPEDVPIAQGWITPVEIIVSQSKDPFFAYKLTNKVSGSSVLARKTDQLPIQTPTPPQPSATEKMIPMSPRKQPPPQQKK